MAPTGTRASAETPPMPARMTNLTQSRRRISSETRHSMPAASAASRNVSRRRHPPVQLADGDALRTGDVAHPTERQQVRHGVGYAADHMGGAEDWDHAILGIDPVQQRDHRRGRTEQRLARRRRFFQAVEFGGEEYGVDRADDARIVRRLHALEPDIAQRLAGDGEATVTQPLQVGAARDEGDIVAGGLQARAVVAAELARAHDRDAHRLSSGCCSSAGYAGRRPPVPRSRWRRRRGNAAPAACRT